MGTLARSPAPVRSNDNIKALLIRHVDVDRRSLGVVVGILEPQGSRIVCHGIVSLDDPRPVDAETVFDVGTLMEIFSTASRAVASQFNVRDLLACLGAALDESSTDLQPAFNRAAAEWRPFTIEKLVQDTPGWRVAPLGGQTIFWNHSGTAKCSAFAGFDRSRRVAVVVLSTGSTVAAWPATSIGMRLLNASIRRVGAN